MTIIKDKNGNKVFEITDAINEDFVMIAGKKFEILSKEKKEDDTIITIKSSVLLED